jgi:molecular chaperone DnaK
MTITGGGALSKEEIDRMMADAESHADEDRQRREEAEIRNQAESLIFQTEKFLEESGDKVPADAKANVDEPLAELKAAIAGEDIAAIKAAVEKVATASQALGAAMYANSQDDASEPEAAGDDDVVDAEIVDENEKV